MALTIIRTPQPVSITSSPILFEANTTLYGTKDFLRLVLRVELWRGGQWIYLGEKTLFPNAAGRCLFDVSNYLASEIASSFSHPVGDIITVHQTTRAVFRVAMWESYYQNGQIINEPEVYTQQYWAIKGGISLELEAQLNDFGTSFYTQWLQEGKFLTWMPRTQTVNPAQPIKLYYLVLPGIDTVRVKVTTYEKNMDGISTTTRAAMFAPAGSVLELNVGYLNLFSTVNDYKYEVWLENGSGQAVSEKFTFVIDETNYINNRFFVFKNSLNGYDTLWCRGAQNTQHKINNTLVERSRALDITGSDPTLVNHRGMRETIYNANTGIIKDADTYDWLAEFFGSEKIYLLDDDYAYACIIKSDTYNGENDFRDPRSVSFSYTKAFAEQYFGRKISEIADLSQGDFNFDFNDDFNIGSNDSGNTTPPSGQVVATEYRCVVNTNGVNTGEQERRYLLADGTGGTYYGEWVNIGVNLISCPLPPTSIKLDVVSENASTLSFRAIVDRGVATADYTVYLNRSVSVPSGYPGLTNPEALAQCPSTLTISSGAAQSNTVTIAKSVIYTDGILSISIASLSPAWLSIGPGDVSVNGTKPHPVLIELEVRMFGYDAHVYVVANRNVPQDVVCQLLQHGGSTLNTTILNGTSEVRAVIVDTQNIVIPVIYSLQSVPEGYWIGENFIVSINPEDPNQ